MLSPRTASHLFILGIGSFLFWWGCGGINATPPQCRAKGQDCGLSADCCNPNLCISGKCQPYSGSGSCSTDGQSCTDSSQCCSGLSCNTGRCTGFSSGGRLLIVQLSSSVQRECSGGYTTIVYDSTGRGIESSPGGGLSIQVPSTWNGWTFVTARCQGNYRDWSSYLGRSASAAGVATINFDGTELVNSYAVVCNDPWGVGIKPAIPLNRENFGRCPQ